MRRSIASKLPRNFTLPPKEKQTASERLNQEVLDRLATYTKLRKETSTVLGGATTKRLNVPINYSHSQIQAVSEIKQILTRSRAPYDPNEPWSPEHNLADFGEPVPETSPRFIRNRGSKPWVRAPKGSGIPSWVNLAAPGRRRRKYASRFDRVDWNKVEELRAARRAKDRRYRQVGTPPPWNEIYFPSWNLVLTNPFQDHAVRGARFRVPNKMTKHEIADYLTKIYGCDVEQVNTYITPASNKYSRFRQAVKAGNIVKERKYGAAEHKIATVFFSPKSLNKGYFANEKNAPLFDDDADRVHAALPGVESFESSIESDTSKPKLTAKVLRNLDRKGGRRGEFASWSQMSLEEKEFAYREATMTHLERRARNLDVKAERKLKKRQEYEAYVENQRAAGAAPTAQEARDLRSSFEEIRLAAKSKGREEVKRRSVLVSERIEEKERIRRVREEELKRDVEASQKAAAALPPPSEEDLAKEEEEKRAKAAKKAEEDEKAKAKRAIVLAERRARLVEEEEERAKNAALKKAKREAFLAEKRNKK